MRARPVAVPTAHAVRRPGQLTARHPESHRSLTVTCGRRWSSFAAVLRRASSGAFASQGSFGRKLYGRDSAGQGRRDQAALSIKKVDARFGVLSGRPIRCQVVRSACLNGPMPGRRGSPAPGSTSPPAWGASPAGRGSAALQPRGASPPARGASPPAPKSTDAYRAALNVLLPRCAGQ